MVLVIAFISQKGGVGKSSLARGLATIAARGHLTVTVADLDAQQRTTLFWGQIRRSRRLSPIVNVRPFDNVRSAVEHARSHGLLIIDAPGRVSEQTIEAAQHADLVVQPTSPSSDELPLALLVFQALEKDIYTAPASRICANSGPF